MTRIWATSISRSQKFFHVLYSDAELNPKIKICICVKADMLGRAEDQQA